MSKSPCYADNYRAGTVKKLFSGTAILAVAAVLTKIIGLIYKVPLVHYVGVEGMAYFLAANHVYVLLFVISTSGLPVAVSVMVSGAVASGDHASVNKIYSTAMSLFAIIGGVGTAAMLGGASKISEWIGMPEAVGCIMAISPAVLMACISGAVRGYFQGHQIMCHTAISQIIEASGKLTLGLLGAIYAINKGMSSEQVAAYAIFGITAGVGFSTVYLIIAKSFFDRKRKGFISSSNVKKLSVMKSLVRLALPITLSSAALSLGGVIDTILIPNNLAYCGFSASEANRLYSCYGNMAVPLFGLVPSLIAPVAVSLVPMVSANRSSDNRNEEKNAICQSIKLTLLVAVPASLGISFFATPILKMIFSSDVNAANMAGPLLSILSLSIIPACLITTTNAILQAQHRAGRTIFSMACGIIVKLFCEYMLVRQKNINIYGAPISTLLCDITVVSINIYYVIKYSPELGELVRDCIGIVWSALLSMGATVIIWYTAGMDSLGNLAVISAVFIAVALYSVAALIFGVVDSTMLNILPWSNNKSDNKLKKRIKQNEQRTKDSISA